MQNIFKTIIKASLTLQYISQVGLGAKDLTEKFRATIAQGYLVQLMHGHPLSAILPFIIHLCLNTSRNRELIFSQLSLYSYDHWNALA